MSLSRSLSALALATASVAALALPAATASAATVQCPLNGGVKVSADESPATVTVPLTNPAGISPTGASGTASVTVTITGTAFTVVANGGRSLSTASWCVKSSTSAIPGTGTNGASRSVNKNGVVQAIGYVVIYDVTTGGCSPAAPASLENTPFC